MSEKMSSCPEGVKSTAVVKYSVPKPSQFLELKCNTDLNLPPANWLSSSVDSYGLQHILYKPQGFSSFRMAQSFIDCIGSVDVVSDAENIKNLLKIPYHKGLISMIVHRIDNTLLLDEFDIYKHILLKAKTEWEWFKKFFLEHVDSDVMDYERSMFLKNKSHKALKQKSLVSKFLYHSLVQNEAPEEMGVLEPSKSEINNVQLNNTSVECKAPILPNPAPSTVAPDPCFDHTYNRNVVWTFEDIEMLLGTDMPIFGGGTHPCISLRLNDMKKPINVLTGIDYWLDNLMCNVPEVVMCYHLNGIVQKYELVKTEELPCLENSKFSPKLIRDVAQNILSFLKTNTTKAGHTYWLFKSKDEDIVKLYDLTSLCLDDDAKNEENPFTVPVAMLLYRVARNIKSSNESRPGTIRQLLKNTIKLLHEEKYPEIVTSSHFMLSDLYIPSGTNPDSPVFDDSDEDCESIYDDDEENEFDTTTKCLYLDGSFQEKSEKNVKKPAPITGTVEERCIHALYHITAGLNCLQYFTEETESEKLKKEEETIPMAKPSEPIPMPYEALNKEDTTKNKKKKLKKNKGKNKKKTDEPNESEQQEVNALLPKEKTEAVPSWQGYVVSSWKEHLKSLLYEKTILVYATLAECHYSLKNYGNSLRYLGILARCLNVRKKFTNKTEAPLEENCLLGRTGDCCIMIVANWDKLDATKSQFHTNMDIDLKIIEQLEKDEQQYKINIGSCSINCVLLYDILTIEQILLKGIECYSKALKFGESDSIMQRLGNNYNEIGSFYLHRGKNTENADISKDSLSKAEQYFKKGLELFEKIKDIPNVALLCTNLGHLYRYLAHMKDDLKLKNSIQSYLDNACVYYKKALDMLGDRNYNPSIWDAVYWELSTTLFNIANAIPTVGVLEGYKGLLEKYYKCLKYCDLNEDNPKLPLYQYRVAEIHNRMAMIYISMLTKFSTQINDKLTLKQTRAHLEKASELFFTMNDVYNFGKNKFQLCSLYECLLKPTSSQQYKLKLLHEKLNVTLDILPIVFKLRDKQIEIPEEEIKEFNINDKAKPGANNITAILLFLKEGLQLTFKQMIKLCLDKTSTIKDKTKLLEVYKELYSSTFVFQQCTEIYSFVDKLCDVMDNIKTKLNGLLTD